MFCQNCGNKIDDGALFCPMCGTKVKREAAIVNDDIKVSEKEALKGAEDAEKANDEINLKKIEPKPIKTATEEDKRQNEEEVKGMFFKKVEVSKELIEELNEAEAASGGGSSETINPKQQETKEKKESALKKIIGNVSDKDLDKPAWRTKPFIFGVIALVVLFVGTLGISFGVGQKARSDYDTEVITFDVYDAYDSSDINEAPMSGWEGDYYYNNGSLVKDEWVYDGGYYYYCSSSGAKVRSDWVQNGNDWYYCDDAGRMISDMLYDIGGAVYYFGSDGKMLTNSYTPDLQHFAGPEGVLVF